MAKTQPSALTPVIVEPRPPALLPAIQRDLAPYLPILRGAANLIAAAVVADFAARYAAPSIASGARQIIAPKPQSSQTILIEEQITIRRRVTYPS